MQFVLNYWKALLKASICSLIWVVLSISIGVLSLKARDTPLEFSEISNIARELLFNGWFFLPLLFFLLFDLCVNVFAIRRTLESRDSLLALGFALLFAFFSILIFVVKQYVSIEHGVIDNFSISLVFLLSGIKCIDYFFAAISRQGYIIKTLY